MTPATSLFSFERNLTVAVGPSPRLVSEGSLRWPHGESASLALVPSLLSVDEVETVLRHVTSAALDTDADTVDEMATYELYLTNQNARRREPSNVAAARAPLRNALNAFLSPIIEERITPFVAQRFAAAFGAAGSPTACTPCFSLVRRYRPSERRTHAAHFDVQALATVVVSLSTAGVDFPARSGLYVSTGGADRRYVSLRAGDAVVHQSDLLHGVDIGDADADADAGADAGADADAGAGTEAGAEAGAASVDAADDAWERWSLILWYKDSPTCEERGHLWNAEAAARGDSPVAAFLHALRVHLDPALHANTNAAAVRKARWMRKAADGGFGKAMNELGMAYGGGLGVPRSAASAARWFRRALDEADEPDAAFNLGQLILERATALEERAARGPKVVYERVGSGGGGKGGGGGGGQGGGQGGSGGDGQGGAWKAADLTEDDDDPDEEADEEELMAQLFSDEVSDPSGAAVRLFERAAAAGAGPWWFNLGVASLRGVGGRARDEAEAARCFLRAGTAQGLYQAARLYGELEGERARSRRWMRRAANAGSEPATKVIGTWERHERAREMLRQWEEEAARNGKGKEEL